MFFKLLFSPQAKYSTTALIDHLKTKSLEELAEMCGVIVEEFKANVKDEKSTKAIFSFLERMFASSIFKPILENPENSFAMDIYTLLRDEVTKTKDSEKLTVSVEIFCQLLQVSDFRFTTNFVRKVFALFIDFHVQVGGKVTKNALSTLCRLLCHRMIWFRKTVALRLTEAMMMYADVCGLSEESEDQVMKILTEFDWENTPIDEIRQKRNELCALFDLPIPKLISAAEQSSPRN